MLKRKLGVFIAVVALLLSAGCGANEAQWASDGDLVFHGIMVGETTYEELLQNKPDFTNDIDLADLGDLMPNEPRSGHVVEYADFTVVADETVQQINIKPACTEPLPYGIVMSDDLTEVLAKLPTEPEKYELTADNEPLALPSYHDSGYLLAHENGSVLMIFAEDLMLQIDFSSDGAVIQAMISVLQK